MPGLGVLASACFPGRCLASACLPGRPGRFLAAACLAWVSWAAVCLPGRCLAVCLAAACLPVRFLAACLAACLVALLLDCIVLIYHDTTGTGAERRGPRVCPGAPAVGSVVFPLSSYFSFGIDFCVSLRYSFLGGVFLWLISLIITIV